MEKTIINPPTLARPIGFSHGVLVRGGRLLFLAGQTLRNLQTVVEAAGGKMQDITKLNIFIRDRDDYLALLKPLGIVHRSFFGAYYPAMALFEVSRFFQNETLVEIEGFAVIDTEM